MRSGSMLGPPKPQTWSFNHQAGSKALLSFFGLQRRALFVVVVAAAGLVVAAAAAAAAVAAAAAAVAVAVAVATATA